MKKIFTLLLAAGIFTVASAQSNNFSHDKFDHSKPQATYAFNDTHDAIRDINRAFDFKIASVKQNRWLSRWEKSKQISQLERQRDAAIAKLQFRNHDHGYSDGRKSRW